ncbi:MAG: Ribonuclease BN [Chlamydiia bacterium]|nr:Ribonuclease BN [Chlamydiia bacterium]MCH9616603.1 Ribonuclease BN [Chlamydiia bacterium]MCH9629333.1 Ribonuclease BN [Chlamydiia bacterium]
MSVRDLTILGCSSQQPTRLRNHGAYLLRWNTEGFLFDPGEGTQRQFIFADIAPPTVTRIFVSHFHGDHCLGLGSMLMRLNLDNVTHPIHVYYPKSGKKYFDRLRYGTIYHERLNVIEYPVEGDGIVHDDGNFRIEARFLNHGVDNIGWRIQEADTVKFEREKLKEFGLKGPIIKELEDKGVIEHEGKKIQLEDVSYLRTGDIFSVVIDTKFTQAAIDTARDAKMLLCESTYLEEHKDLAKAHYHLTARQAAEIARDAGAQKLILTHYSARYRDVEEFADEARTIFQESYAADDFRRFEFPR